LLSLHQDRAARSRRQTSHGPQQRGFAGSRRTDDGQELSGSNQKGNILDDALAAELVKKLDSDRSALECRTCGLLAGDRISFLPNSSMASQPNLEESTSLSRLTDIPKCCGPDLDIRRLDGKAVGRETASPATTASGNLVYCAMILRALRGDFSR